MQSDNVISFHQRKKESPPTDHFEETHIAQKEDHELSFAEIMRRNAENQERMRRERLKANQGVIRSHRLKK